MEEDDTDAGRPEQFTAERVLTLFSQSRDPCEPRTAKEVADELGCARRTALGKLKDLADDGELESKKVGSRSRVYWQPGSD